MLPDTFISEPTIDAILIQQKTPWCSPERTKVTISVAAEAADYFRQREQLPEQEIIESRSDGSLLLTTKIAHQKQLFPVIRYWLPHLRIVEPEEWRQEQEEELKSALNICLAPVHDSTISHTCHSENN